MGSIAILIGLLSLALILFGGSQLRNVMIQSNCPHCDKLAHEGNEDNKVAWEGYAQRIRDHADGKLEEWDEAVSGPGSKAEHVKPLLEFLTQFIQDRNITSVVDVSCGHWPSGWQQRVNWGGVKYYGRDITPENIQENTKFFGEQGPSKFALEAADFEAGDMRDPLPPADLLITKDTIIHIPNWAINEFLETNVKSCPPKFKYVLFIHDRPPEWKFRWGGVPIMRDLVWNWDTFKFSGFHEIDVRVKPFHLRGVEEMLQYMTSSQADRAPVNPKVVQLYVPKCGHDEM